MNSDNQLTTSSQRGRIHSSIGKVEQMPLPRQCTSRNLRATLLGFTYLFAVGCGQVDETTASKETPTANPADRSVEMTVEDSLAAPEAEQGMTQQETAPSETPTIDDSKLEADAGQMTEQLAGTESLDTAAVPNRKMSSSPEPSAAVASGFGGAMPNEDLNAGSEMEARAFRSQPTPGQPGMNRSEQLQKLSEARMLSQLGVNGQRARKLKANPSQSVSSFDLQPGEELWVIARPIQKTIGNANNRTPRCGKLMATLPTETVQVPVPLKHTSVNANVDGYIATVDVQQQFHNPYDSKIEATYTFPLPDSAAVNEFVMTIGDRKIRGIIREREKAEKIYKAAKSQGHVASLMTQERANIFTQKVANIEPGKQIDINIRYFNTLRYDDGSYEFVFPMVVGPRYNPPGSSDGVGAVARKANGTSGQKTEVSYLAPNERSGHDISLALNISAGVAIEDVLCVNHAIDQNPVSESQRKITLSSQDSIPNKDFVLRYKVAGHQIKTAMLTHEDDQGKYFTMMMYPPADLQQVERSAMEMVFVLDCSGSMKGKPLAQAKKAIAHALQSLTPRDTFQIIQFSSNSSQLGSEPVVVNEQNVRAGMQYLSSLSGGGGTRMIEGIKAALDFPHDEGRFRLVSFMTDGFIGNEQEILQTLNEKLESSRIFSFGVGSSPNRMLMDRMAILGKGAVAYLSLNDDAVQIMDRFNRRISHPAMTDLQIDWGQLDVTDVYPQRLPDLIVGRPIVVTGRFTGEPSVVKVNGRVGTNPTTFDVTVDTQDSSKNHEGVAAVWARLKIKDLMNASRQTPQEFADIRNSVIQTAQAYNLMSSFTAFVAVDSMTQTAAGVGTTVAVPVRVPDGVKYETTVGDGSDE